MNIRALEKEIKGKRAGKYTPMYVYGTEMMEYYAKIGVKNKRVLTIAGSGDQIINAYFHGARDVVGFDLNKLAKLFVELKFAAIQTLTYKEFLRFFGEGKGNASLDYSFYVKFRRRLGNRARVFFDKLYKYFDFDGARMGKSSFFHQRDFTGAGLTDINAYLKNEKAYLKARKILSRKKPQVIESNITKIGAKVKGKFGVINISNVPNFLTSFYRNKGDKDPVMRFYDGVLLDLKRILKPKGKIFFYTYELGSYPNPFATKGPPPISIPAQLRRLKKWKELKYSEFGLSGIFGGRDKIVVLRK